MMQDPIQNCICNDRIIKYIIPRIKIYICCQNGASFFISQIYQLEEQFCIIFFNWQITRFINDQQLILKKVSQSGFQTVFQFGFLKLLYQIMTLYKVSAVSFFLRLLCRLKWQDVFSPHRSNQEKRYFLPPLKNAVFQNL